MNLSFRKHPLYRLLILVGLLGCILSIYYIVSKYGIGLVTYGDSVQYWAAGKLMLSGLNPYSPEHVIQLRYQAGNLYEAPSNATSMMLYPPWSIPFLLPFGILDYPLSRLLWLIFNIIILIFSIRLLWTLYGGSNRFILLAYGIAFTFASTLFVLGMGHITPLHLLGITGFLYFIQAQRSDLWNNILAGASVSLVLIKPQLQYLLLFALLLWVIDNRRWLIPIGGAATILGLTAISVMINPQIIGQYWESFTSYSLGTWVTPTIGSLLREVFGWEKEWLQILPIVFGLIWFLIRWRKNRGTWDWIKEMPLLLLVCAVTSPYTWTYDMVVLLVPIIAFLSDLIRIHINWRWGIIITIYFTANIFTYYMHRYLPDHWYFWFAPTLLVLYLIGSRLIQKEKLDKPNVIFEIESKIPK